MNTTAKKTLWIFSIVVLIGGGIGIYLYIKPKEGDEKIDKNGSKWKFVNGVWKKIIETVKETVLPDNSINQTNHSTSNDINTNSNVKPPTTTTTVKQIQVPPTKGLGLYAGTDNAIAYIEKSKGYPNPHQSILFKKDALMGIVNSIWNIVNEKGELVRYVRFYHTSQYYYAWFNNNYSLKNV